MSRTITSGTDDNGEEFVNCDGLQSTKKTDDFGRVTSINTSINSAAPFITTYQYFGGIEENSTSNTVNRLENHYKGNCYAVYNYTYDNNGNITQVKLNGTLISKYTYDSLNQLYEEYDYLRGRYINYTYDNGGNIKLALESYLNSSGTIGGVCGSKNYTYGDSVWKDKLTKYGTYNITYDEIGNPLNYRDGITFSWKNGRWLASTTLSDNTTVTYQYNANGMRTKKTVGSTVTNYYYDSNNNLIGLKSGSDVAFFYYGADNSPVSMKYNNNMYYYVKNLQGDIVKILDSNGSAVASYYYDAWGTITRKTVNNTTIDTLSPFRYRGYVYDTDTGLYYLQSRYYDPQTGRFINADDTAFIGATGTALSGNIFAYCENNPINKVDNYGYKAIDISYRLLKTMISNAKYLFSFACWHGLFGCIGKLAILYKFYKLVKTNGKWDFKNQSSWKLKNKKDYYTFFGYKVSVADIGNIHFGFVGSVLFSWRTLCTGAGIYQIYSGTSKWSYWYSFFDDPRDTFCISIGRIFWRIFYPICRFQW